MWCRCSREGNHGFHGHLGETGGAYANCRPSSPQELKFAIHPHGVQSILDRALDVSYDQKEKQSYISCRVWRRTKLRHPVVTPETSDELFISRYICKALPSKVQFYRLCCSKPLGCLSVASLPPCGVRSTLAMQLPIETWRPEQPESWDLPVSAAFTLISVALCSATCECDRRITERRPDTRLPVWLCIVYYAPIWLGFTSIILFVAHCGYWTQHQKTDNNEDTQKTARALREFAFVSGCAGSCVGVCILIQIAGATLISLANLWIEGEMGLKFTVTLRHCGCGEHARGYGLCLRRDRFGAVRKH